MSESGDLIIPNSGYSPLSPPPTDPERTMRQRVVSEYSERNTPFQLFQFENTPRSSGNKRRGDDIIYSFIKKPCKGRRSKIIRLQIYDVEEFQESASCNCEASVCAQYVVENIFNDDVYKSARDILSKMYKKM
ncbi:hypothetical protein B5X24_HaOG215658 [Helicoverpa armigera]|nr:hypothetical protein B5X24_HaOG215658 [Helicoverpa armigera]